MTDKLQPLAKTIVATMRDIGAAPDPERPNEILINLKDLEAVIEEHLDEWLAKGAPNQWPR